MFRYIAPCNIQQRTTWTVATKNALWLLSNYLNLSYIRFSVIVTQMCTYAAQTVINIGSTKTTQHYHRCEKLNIKSAKCGRYALVVATIHIPIWCLHNLDICARLVTFSRTHKNQTLRIINNEWNLFTVEQLPHHLHNQRSAKDTIFIIFSYKICTECSPIL